MVTSVEWGHPHQQTHCYTRRTRFQVLRDKLTSTEYTFVESSGSVQLSVNGFLKCLEDKWKSAGKLPGKSLCKSPKTKMCF